MKKFELAAELAPHNVEYLTAREFTRQQLVMEALKRGNQAMLDHNEIVAMADFRRALEFDPTNEYALQRLRDRYRWRRTADCERTSGGAVHSDRNAAHGHRTTTSISVAMRKTLLTQVAQAYGITAQFDDSVQQQRVRFDIEDVNFATAMEAADPRYQDLLGTTVGQADTVCGRHRREPPHLPAHVIAHVLSARPGDRPGADGDDQLPPRASEPALHRGGQAQVHHFDTGGRAGGGSRRAVAGKPGRRPS